jgi:hypothetical protein
MTETVSSKASADGWNEPTKNLPPLEVRELPEPVPLGKLIGASVILLATALGSGELLIWPYITTQAGVGLLWLATLGSCRSISSTWRSNATPWRPARPP